MPCLIVSIQHQDKLYPKQLACICDSDVKPTYKMFPIDIGNGEALVVTIERKKII